MFKVPRTTSVFRNDNKSPVDTITFAPELVNFISDRRKYRTYRFADDKYKRIQVGDVVYIKERGKETVFAKALITVKKSVLFSQIPPSSPLAHESYRDREHMRRVISGYYAFLGRPVKDDDQFFVIDFKLIK
jgi:hypothetical protein